MGFTYRRTILVYLVLDWISLKNLSKTFQVMLDTMLEYHGEEPGNGLCSTMILPQTGCKSSLRTCIGEDPCAKIDQIVFAI